MRFNKRILCTAAALTCLAAFPSMAAETREEYRAEKAVIQAELDSVNDMLAPLTEENKAAAENFRAVKDARQAGTSSVSDENWEKAKELRSQIRAIREEKLPSSDENESADKGGTKTAVQSGDYDQALAILSARLESKKARLEPVTEINNLWKQIDELLK